MTIKDAIEELEQIKTSDDYINARLRCIIEDLTNHMNSPSVDEEYLLNDGIAKQIENKSSALLGNVSHSWVNDLYRSILNMFRYEKCKQYYSREKDRKEIKKVIDGETSSKWIEIISAGWTILACCVALIWFSIDKTGFSSSDGKLDFDKWGFIIVLGSALLVIIVSVVVAIINAVRKRKYSKNPDFSYSVDELLAVEYENKPKQLRFLFPTAAKISKCQIVIGDNNRQSQGNKAKAKNGAKVYQNAGDVIESIPKTNSAE